jgi:hypothetical protein
LEKADGGSFSPARSYALAGLELSIALASRSSVPAAMTSTGAEGSVASAVRSSDSGGSQAGSRNLSGY